MIQINTEQHQSYYYTFITISKIVSEEMYLKIISIIIDPGKIIVSKIVVKLKMTVFSYLIHKTMKVQRCKSPKKTKKQKNSENFKQINQEMEKECVLC